MRSWSPCWTRWRGCSTCGGRTSSTTRLAAGVSLDYILQQLTCAIRYQVFFAYAILTPSECTLFAQEASLSSKVKQYLAKYNVQVQPYDEVWTALKSLGETAQSRIDQVEDEAETTSEEKEAGGKVLIGKKTSAAVVNAIGEDRTHTARSPITDAKSIKNEVRSLHSRMVTS